MSIEPVLRWAPDQEKKSARIVAVKGMRAGAGPWRLGIDHGGETVEAVLRIGDPDIGSRRRLATEAAALALAEEHRLAAPRLLAVDLDGDTTGRPALLMTVLAGSSTIPTIASVVRLRASGAAAAALHAVATTPRPDLPLRVRPLGDVDFAAQRLVAVAGCRRATAARAADAAEDERVRPRRPVAGQHTVGRRGLCGHGGLGCGGGGPSRHRSGLAALRRGDHVRPARRGRDPGRLAAGAAGPPTPWGTGTWWPS